MNGEVGRNLNEADDKGKVMATTTREKIEDGGLNKPGVIVVMARRLKAKRGQAWTCFGHGTCGRILVWLGRIIICPNIH